MFITFSCCSKVMGVWRMRYVKARPSKQRCIASILCVCAALSLRGGRSLYFLACNYLLLNDASPTKM